ncbi:MAG: ROK family transcriptional regulator [Candidatus Marinimicrobia bacterium]|jgi:predicted NBD/HSP70 family sugar kinase/AraC-like DNA-binding protein|nr:ROK family transcriptional regulator [Candidatus Neomarinimicrobiota bacterium]MBT4361635.1 ROK family transcriptional regulator [Candidatus Neomarinimicrobiota bacterium]MBT4714001.1 ROK family transcriptional regulator [Candidatus Neomarinimicrobiota bacterium]MBT4947043.1 ROK family transcriptional regulator [Candidatus Neomarinimicrobiota bacterium]MBT5268459.1 ROK family transcriptional regulator [Candidatus Neomarinimicrobiota bacterium]
MIDPKDISRLSSNAGYSQSDSLGRRIVDRWESKPLADSVLHLIWHKHQISRAEIARELGLSRSTVTEVVKELLNSGFVKEVGSGISSGGRKPIVLEFQNEARIILGIDIGATHVAATLIDLSGEVLAFVKQDHFVRTDPKGTRNLVFEICDAILSEIKNGSKRLLCIGVALPSPVDPNHPEWLSEVVIPAWRGHSEIDLLHRHFNVPVYVDNDANLGALAEHRWGAGRGVKDLTYVKLGYGVGAGFILNGEVYRGGTGIAGEMGHIPIKSDGELCECGLKGCLVTLVGGKAMETRVEELLSKYPDSMLADKLATLKNIEIAAGKQDALALQLFKETAEYVSIAITGWINMMNPRRVILGGDRKELQQQILNPIQVKIRDCSIVGSVDSTEVRTGELGEKAESMGAATLALEEVFSEPGFYMRKSL